MITPPFTQVNCPYPATAYLKGYLERKGFPVDQFDLSIELIGAIFTKGFLQRLFDRYPGSEDENIRLIYRMRERYTATVDAVTDFLRGKDGTLATRICTGEYLPQAARFGCGSKSNKSTIPTQVPVSHSSIMKRSWRDS